MLLHHSPNSPKTETPPDKDELQVINTEDRTVVRKYIGSVTASHKAVTSECIAHIRGEKVSKYVANILLLISGPSCKCIASGMYPAKFWSFCINHIQTVFA